MVSKNRCAFPECHEPLLDYKTKTITGERCHIKGENPTSARFDPAQSQKDRNSFENLIMMCEKHHKIIDADPDTYTVEVLLEMKKNHEKSSDVSPASILKSLENMPQQLAKIEDLIREMNKDD